MDNRFDDWQFPEIVDGRPTKYNWVVQNTENFKLGYRTDIGAFSYINAKYGVTIADFVQIGSHCSIYSVSTIDDKSGPVILKKKLQNRHPQCDYAGCDRWGRCRGGGIQFCESGCACGLGCGGGAGKAHWQVM
jgi:hypothetical protein